MNSNRFSKLTGVILFTILAVKMMGCGLFNDKAQLVPELTMKIENMELSQGELITFLIFSCHIGLIQLINSSLKEI